MKPTINEILAARTAAGLTQTAAAAVIYSTLRTWQDWEGGQSSMHEGLFELFILKTKKIRDFELTKKQTRMAKELKPVQIEAIRSDNRLQKIIAVDYGISNHCVKLIKNS